MAEDLRPARTLRLLVAWGGLTYEEVATSHASRVVMLKDGLGHRAGDVPISTTILKTAIVDRAGQTP